MSLFYPQVTHNIDGNTSGTTANISSGTLFLAGGNNITLSQDANTITISAGAGGGSGGDAIRGIAAGASTQTTDTVNFSNSNGFSFGFTSTDITGSHNALTSQSTQYQALQLGGNTSGTTSFDATNNATLFIHGGNNITLSGNGASVTISAGASGGGGDAIRGIAAGGSTQTTNTVNFSNSNGISFGFNAGANSTVLTASHNGLTSQSTQYLAIELGGNKVGTETFFATNNASIFLHGGNNITLSGNGSTVTISGGAGSGNTPVIYQYPIIDERDNDQGIYSGTGNTAQLTLSYIVNYTPITADLHINEIVQNVSMNTQTNTTRGSVTNNFMFGLYTKSGSTLSLASSYKAVNICSQTSNSYTVSWYFGNNSTSNSSSTGGTDVASNFSGNRRILFNTDNQTITSNNYYYIGAVAVRRGNYPLEIARVYANPDMPAEQIFGSSAPNVVFDLNGIISQTTSGTNYPIDFVMPNSFNITQITRSIATSLYSLLFYKANFYSRY